jgi:hypothetical protein
MIFHLLYISQKTPIYNEEMDLDKIIKRSNERNQENEITGMLVKNGNFFIQLLEGNEKSVLRVYDDISRDRRHSNVKTLMTFKNSTRIFPDWYMGLIKNEDYELSLRELIPLLHVDVLKTEGSKEKVISILKQFNQISDKNS